MILGYYDSSTYNQKRLKQLISPTLQFCGTCHLGISSVFALAQEKQADTIITVTVKTHRNIRLTSLSTEYFTLGAYFCFLMSQQLATLRAPG